MSKSPVAPESKRPKESQEDFLKKFLEAAKKADIGFIRKNIELIQKLDNKNLRDVFIEAASNNNPNFFLRLDEVIEFGIEQHREIFLNPDGFKILMKCPRVAEMLLTIDASEYDVRKQVRNLAENLADRREDDLLLKLMRIKPIKNDQMFFNKEFGFRLARNGCREALKYFNQHVKNIRNDTQELPGQFFAASRGGHPEVADDIISTCKTDRDLEGFFVGLAYYFDPIKHDFTKSKDAFLCFVQDKLKKDPEQFVIKILPQVLESFLSQYSSKKIDNDVQVIRELLDSVKNEKAQLELLRASQAALRRYCLAKDASQVFQLFADKFLSKLEKPLRDEQMKDYCSALFESGIPRNMDFVLKLMPGLFLDISKSDVKEKKSDVKEAKRDSKNSPEELIQKAFERFMLYRGKSPQESDDSLRALEFFDKTTKGRDGLRKKMFNVFNAASQVYSGEWVESGVYGAILSFKKEDPKRKDFAKSLLSFCGSQEDQNDFIYRNFPIVQELAKRGDAELIGFLTAESSEEQRSKMFSALCQVGHVETALNLARPNPELYKKLINNNCDAIFRDALSGNKADLFHNLCDEITPESALKMLRGVLWEHHVEASERGRKTKKTAFEKEYSTLELLARCDEEIDINRIFATSGLDEKEGGRMAASFGQRLLALGKDFYESDRTGESYKRVVKRFSNLLQAWPDCAVNLVDDVMKHSRTAPLKSLMVLLPAAQCEQLIGDGMRKAAWKTFNSSAEDIEWNAIKASYHKDEDLKEVAEFVSSNCPDLKLSQRIKEISQKNNLTVSEVLQIKFLTKQPGAMHHIDVGLGERFSADLLGLVGQYYSANLGKNIVAADSKAKKVIDRLAKKPQPKSGKGGYVEGELMLLDTIDEVLAEARTKPEEKKTDEKQDEKKDDKKTDQKKDQKRDLKEKKESPSSHPRKPLGTGVDSGGHSRSQG